MLWNSKNTCSISYQTTRKKLWQRLNRMIWLRLEKGKFRTCRLSLKNTWSVTSTVKRELDSSISETYYFLTRSLSQEIYSKSTESVLLSTTCSCRSIRTQKDTSNGFTSELRTRRKIVSTTSTFWISQSRDQEPCQDSPTKMIRESASSPNSHKRTNGFQSVQAKYSSWRQTSPEGKKTL